MKLTVDIAELVQLRSLTSTAKARMTAAIDQRSEKARLKASQDMNELLRHLDELIARSGDVARDMAPKPQERHQDAVQQHPATDEPQVRQRPQRAPGRVFEQPGSGPASLDDLNKLL